MRTLYFFSFLLFSIATSAQNIQMFLSTSHLTINPNQSRQITLSFIPVGGFNQQLFITDNCPSNCYGISRTYSQNSILPPYPNVTLTLNAAGSATLGTHQIVFTAANGPVSDTDTLVVDVIQNQCLFSHYPPMISNAEEVLATTNGVWVGGESLTHNSGTSQTTYTTANSQFPGSCKDICEDVNGHIWMATYDGIVKFDGTYWTIYDSSNSALTTNTFSSIAIDTSGNIWVTSDFEGQQNNGDGIFKFDGTNWTKFDSTNTAMPTNDVSHLRFDRNGKLWVFVHHPLTNHHQIFNYDGTNWTTFPLCIQLHSVSDIFFDSQNNAWFSNTTNLPGSPIYSGLGLVKFDGVTVEVWSDSLATPYNHIKFDQNCYFLIQDNLSTIHGAGVYSIFVDSNDIVWGGMTENHQGTGLFAFDGTNFTTFTTQNSQLGLPLVVDISEINGNLFLINGHDPHPSTVSLTSYTCSTATGINELSKEEEMFLFPNPTSSEFTIKGNESQNGSLKIFDITGRVVYESNHYDVNQTIAVNLPSGLYQCIFESESKIYTKKLVMLGN